MNKVLLHACCAVCAAYPIELLRELGYSVVVYFFNPNIYPKVEYERRLGELIRYTSKKNIELIIDDPNISGWNDFISGLENEPERGERCRRCFEYRLIFTAVKALKLGIRQFTTTLSVSPHKNTKMIFDAAKEIAQKHGLKFLEFDFKKQNGFLKTMKIAKEENFYRQNYCGCKYSIRTKSTPILKEEGSYCGNNIR